MPLAHGASSTEMRVRPPGSDAASLSLVSSHPGSLSGSSVVRSSYLWTHTRGGVCPGGSGVPGTSVQGRGRLAVPTLVAHPAPGWDCSTRSLSACSQLSRAEDCAVGEKRVGLFPPSCYCPYYRFPDLWPWPASSVGVDGRCDHGQLAFLECHSGLLMTCDRGEAPPSRLRALTLNDSIFYVDCSLLDCLCNPWDQGLVA